MVEINVAQFLKSPLGTTRIYEIDEPVRIGDDEPVVRGAVTFLRTNRGILVTGKLVTSIDLSCSRCLGQHSQPLTLEIEEEFFPTVDILTGAEAAVPEDEPEAFTIDQNNVLDLSEAIRQYALLTAPMKPLCREDCQGLCPTCGTNLNVKTCHCPPQVNLRSPGLVVGKANEQ
jgi:uncharacterized protein